MGIVDEDLNVEIDETETETVTEDIQEEETIENSEVSEESEEPEIVQDEEDEEDRVVTIGDSSSEDESEEDEKVPDKTELVKKLRKVTRGLEKKNKALQKQIEANKKATEIEKPVELGEEPTLASCKYDDVKYKQEILAYAERKRKVEEQTAQKQKEVEAQDKVWKDRQEQYVSLKQEHNFKDFGDAEEYVSSTLSNTQQGIIVQGSKDAALLVYALGKNPKKLEELAQIKNPVDFAFAVATVENQLKVSSKKAPAPEKRVSATKAGGLSGQSDKTLERLREEAAKTGDMTKVVAYKKKLKSKG